MVRIDITHLIPPKKFSLKYGWTFTYNDIKLPYSLPPYKIKQRIWKAKHARKLRTMEVENSSGSSILCSKCNGLGYSNHNFTWWCGNCDGLGTVDWIKGIRK
jgi:hypothetical protein